MQILKGSILLMMVSICLSYEYEIFPDVLICNKNLMNKTRRILMNIESKDFPKNNDESLIKEIGEFLVCYHFGKEKFNQSNIFEDEFPLEQLEDYFLNQYNNLIYQMQKLHQLNIILRYKIEYVLDQEPLNEQNNQLIFFISLSFNQSQEENFLDMFNFKFNISLKDSDSSIYRIIQHYVVCAIIVILQAYQIKVLSKKEFQWEALFLEEFESKVLILPFLLQIIVDNTFFVSLIKEMGAISSDNDNFLIYFIPGALQAWILYLDWKWLWCTFIETKWLVTLLNSTCLLTSFSMSLAVLNIVSIIMFSTHYEKNIYYQYSFPYIYLPQILYSFGFKILSLDKRIIFANLSTKMFYVIYLRGYPFKTRDVDSNLQLAIIDGSAFVLQLLIFYLQNRYGPQNLMTCNCFKGQKRKVYLLEEIKNEECSICLTPFGLCNHKFHHTCLLEWFEEQQTCPICRDQLEPEIFL